MADDEREPRGWLAETLGRRRRAALEETLFRQLDELEQGPLERLGSLVHLVIGELRSAQRQLTEQAVDMKTLQQTVAVLAERVEQLEGRVRAEAKPAAFARHGALELALPQCDEGIGAVILKPDAPELIEGVRIEPFALWPDDRGHFLEVQRMGQGLAGRFPLAETQISAAVNYPGTIKAFHYHLRQTDCWTPASGMLQMALVDLRAGSPTFGRRNTIYAGALRPWRVLIPPGVAHGYKVIGGREAVLIYATDRFYDPADEGRIPYDSPEIHYDWETQHK